MQAGDRLLPSFFFEAGGDIEKAVLPGSPQTEALNVLAGGGLRGF